LGDKIKKNEIVGHVACVGDRRGACRVSVDKSKEKIPLGRPERRWEDNITTYFPGSWMGWREMDWIDLAQDRDKRRALVYAVMNIQFPLNAGNFLTS
jgi:hypothetical protein